MQRSRASVSELWYRLLSALATLAMHSRTNLATASPTNDTNTLPSLDFERNFVKDLGTSCRVASGQLLNREATTGRPVRRRVTSRGRLRLMFDDQVLLDTLQTVAYYRSHVRSSNVVKFNENIPATSNSLKMRTNCKMVPLNAAVIPNVNFRDK